jgi:hypothetical protein
MVHQLLHCQSRIFTHRLACALQQSGVPALRPGDGRGQPHVRQVQECRSAESWRDYPSAQTKPAGSIERYHLLSDLLDAGGQPLLGTDQFFRVPGQFLFHGMANERGR